MQPLMSAQIAPGTQLALLTQVAAQATHLPAVQRWKRGQAASAAQNVTAQAPCPSHRWPEAQKPCGSAVPSATGVQIPGLAARAQLRHGPGQADAQHTPWAQNPLLHSSFAVQDDLTRTPQLPEVQLFPAAQSSGPLQEVPQRPVATSQR